MDGFFLTYGPVVAAMIIVAVIAHMRLMEIPAYRGWWGEYKVNLFLKLCLSGDYRVFSNGIYRDNQGSTTQVDHIVVSRYGIFVVETKSLKGRLVISSEDPAKWIQIVGRRKYQLDSPHKQNHAHIKALQRVTGIHSQKFHSFVALAGSARFAEAKPERVYSIWELIRKIQSYKAPVLTRAAVYSINQRLSQHRIKGGYWAARHHSAKLRGKHQNRT